MITARSPFQIYKAEEASGSVSAFNSLPIEDVLPYKIASAEETLLASLAIVETDDAQKTRYAVSVIHAAASYVSHLISYVPLSARSQTAKKIDIHYDALVRTVMMFGSDAGLFAGVKNMVMRNVPADQVSLKELSDVEGALTAMEKEYRQTAREAGERVEMLRKVAPEPPVVVVTSSSSQPVTPPPATTSSDAAGNSPGKRRPRSQSTEPAAQGEDGEAKVAKVEGKEAADPTAPADGAAGKPTQKARRAKAGGSTSSNSGGGGASGLVWGRLRALTLNEKKAVGVLQTIVQLLAHVYATKVNDLVPLFDLLEEKVQAVQAIIDSERAQYEARGEDKKPPEPFHEVSLETLRRSLATSSHIFRTDEDCRHELDEDLLHPIAHACLTVINHIEGYTTEQFTPPTAEELERKQQLRDAARAKREEAKRRIVERAEAKAEIERKREEEKQLVRRRLGDDDVDDDENLVEDSALASPSTLGYVAYADDLPLPSAALFEQALYVWSMIASVPQALSLSQMSFAMFVRGLQCEDQDANGLMEEVTRCLLEVSREAVRVGSPNTPRIATRGKNWFDALVEFVGVASGTKQKRQQQQRRRAPSIDEEEEEDDDSSDSDSDSEGDDEDESSSSEAEEAQDEENTAAPTSPIAAEPATETTAAKPPEEAAAAAAVVEEEADIDPFTAELRYTMANITRLRALATWGNVDIADRLNLLQFCVQEALTSEAVRADADRLLKEREDEVVSTEKRLKEIRDEAEKELKALLRTLPVSTAIAAAAAGPRRGKARKTAPSTEEEGENAEGVDGERDYEVEREAILQAVDRKRAEAHAHVWAKEDSLSDGAVVQLLGMDRHKRLYWRFPLDRCVLVQTVEGVTQTPFPILPEPAELRRGSVVGRSLLLDDEPDSVPSTWRGGRATTPSATAEQVAVVETVPAQQVWGSISAAHLTTFARTLDCRGRREGPLRRVLETLGPYLTQLEEVKEGRVTRSRANMFGYFNHLKSDFSY